MEKIMATTTAKGSGSTVNDGGSVLGVGPSAIDSTSPMTSGIGLNDAKTGSEYGSKVKANDGSGGEFTDPQGVTTAKSAGTGGLAYSPARGERNFIIKAAGADGAGKINNDSSTLLTIPGAQYDSIGQDSIHATVADRRIGSDADRAFDVLAVPTSGVVPGRTKGSNAGDANTFVMASGNVPAADDAASPTRAVPGELTYHFGGLGKATTDEYKARDSYEDETDTSS
jgi:hypothetical protein